MRVSELFANLLLRELHFSYNHPHLFATKSLRAHLFCHAVDVKEHDIVDRQIGNNALELDLARV